MRNLMAYRVDVLHMNKSDYTKRYLFFRQNHLRGMRKNLPAAENLHQGNHMKKSIWTCSGHVEDKESCCRRSHPGGCAAPGFTDMGNKLYTNQGTILEPLLKELTEFVASKAGQ